METIVISLFVILFITIVNVSQNKSSANSTSANKKKKVGSLYKINLTNGDSKNLQDFSDGQWGI